jgi:hypothetical protein
MHLDPETTTFHSDPGLSGIAVKSSTTAKEAMGQLFFRQFVSPDISNYVEDIRNIFEISRLVRIT